MNDLDARVAALMQIFDTWSGLNNPAARAEMKQAIRAELQKPALHEAVTDAEVELAWKKLCEQECLPNKDMLRAAINYVLQGRAQPAQEEIGWLRGALELTVQYLEMPSSVQMTKQQLIFKLCAVIRASKGEKT